MMFQVSDLNGSQFFNLLDSNDNIIEPSYIIIIHQKKSLVENFWSF